MNTQETIEQDWKKEFLRIADGGNAEKQAQALLLIERTLHLALQKQREEIVEMLEGMPQGEGIPGAIQAINNLNK